MKKILPFIFVSAVAFSAGYMMKGSVSPELADGAIEEMDSVVSSDSSAEVKEPTVRPEERKPFFPQPSEVKEGSQAPGESKVEDVQADEQKEDLKVVTSNSGIDYFSLRDQLNTFQDQVFKEIDNKFPDLDKDGKAFPGRKAALGNRIENLFQKNQLWFAADIGGEHDDVTQLILYFNYYSCNKIGNKTKERFKNLKKTCFMITLFSQADKRWNQVSISANVDNIRWRRNKPYVGIHLSALGGVSEELKALQLMVPFPDESAPVYLLRYENKKFRWEDFGDITWSASSENARDKFRSQVITQ
jgi:hypothetical protein